MPDILETLGKLIGTNWKHRDTAKRHSRTFLCRCGNHIFFGNRLCLGCQAPLGYLPADARLVPLDPGPQPGTRRAPSLPHPVLAIGAKMGASRGNNETTSAQPPESPRGADRLNPPEAVLEANGLGRHPSAVRGFACVIGGAGRQASSHPNVSLNPPNRRIRTRMYGGVGAVAPPCPDSDLHHF
jgi:zinc-ribbon domain